MSPKIETETTTESKRLHAVVRTLSKTYFAGALIVTNTLLIFVLLNLVLFAVIRIREYLASDPAQISDVIPEPPVKAGQLFYPDGSPVDNGKRSRYELKWFDFATYEGIDSQYADEVLTGFNELSKLGFIYQPWVQFSEPPLKGRQVNVDLDERGFPIRRTINPPNNRGLPVVKIFAFGGSTTFGYHVSDEHTWPSHLSRILNQKAEADGLNIHFEVVNYGRAYYNPSIETVLMADVLKSGHRPALVLFMDGLNETLTPDVPYLTPKAAEGFRKMQYDSFISRLDWMPAVRFVNFAQRRWFGSDSGEEAIAAADPHRVDHIVNAFNQDRQIATSIAKLYGAETMFFLQPHVADYNLDLFRRPMPNLKEFLRLGQEVVRPSYARLRTTNEWKDLSDLFERWGKNRKAIVDDCHYGPNFNEFLADHVASYVKVSAIRPTSGLDEAAATGEPKRVDIREDYLRR